MTQIWIVKAAEYEDNSAVAAFTTKELAEGHREQVDAVSGGTDYEVDTLDRLDGGQTFAEATAGVPDAVKQAVAGVGVSMAEAARILKQYGQAWRASLTRDQEERKP